MIFTQENNNKYKFGSADVQNTLRTWTFDDTFNPLLGFYGYRSDVVGQERILGLGAISLNKPRCTFN
jgi:hypothetical protein